MATDDQIALGQCYVDARLYYTTGGPSGSKGLWMTSTAGLEPLGKFLDRHPEAVPPGLSELLKSQGTKADNLAARAHVRWSTVSRDAFLAGNRNCDPKVIYSQLRDFIAKYHWTSEPANYDLLTTFVMASYLFTVADAAPNLHLIGDPNTGKTRVSELVERFGFNPVMVSDTTSPGLFRHLALIRSLVLLDEQDGMAERRLGAVLRAGYRQSGAVLLCESGIPVALHCFSPKVIVTTCELTDQALATRVIRYTCERAPQPVEKFLDRLTKDEVAELRDDLHIFGLTAAPEIADRYATHPHVDGVSNRDEELGGLLWAVAAYVDDQPGPDLRLHDKLVRLMQGISEERRRGRELDGEKIVLKVAVENYLVEHGQEHVDGYPGYHLAEKFLKYVNTCCDLEHRIPNTKIASEKLRRHGLLADKKRARVRVDGASQVPGMPRSVDNRVQRTAFKFTDTLSINSNT
jgi:hypothetical protein